MPSSWPVPPPSPGAVGLSARAASPENRIGAQVRAFINGDGAAGVEANQ
jgi:hypothetical protein